SIFKENTKDPFYFVTQFQNFLETREAKKTAESQSRERFVSWRCLGFGLRGHNVSVRPSVCLYYRPLGWGFSRHYLGARSSPAPRSGARESGRPSGTGDGQTHGPVLQLSGVFAVSSSSVSHEVHQETGLYEYKVFGVLATCSAELCADVYMDLTYRKHWDKYAKELYEKDFDGETAIYWEVKYPFPLSNRDYVYVRERRDLDVNGRKIWVILARSSPETACPEKSGVLRVNDYKQSVALESDGANGTRVFMNYFDNPGGMIPKWVINWAAKSGVPGFLTDMQKACSNYKNYLQSTGA
uniref:Phosphatidylcholine transfer protein n=1 Tax=Oryzias latipes TaxID=8090 RepID=A0A3P9MH37_ORYLA